MKIRLWVDYTNFSLQLVFYENRSDGVYAYNPYTKIIKKIDQNTMQIPEEFIAHLPKQDDTLKELADAIANMGIKTDSDFKIQGLLEATKYHLEDMRSLLKLKKEVK